MDEHKKLMNNNDITAVQIYFFCGHHLSCDAGISNSLICEICWNFFFLKKKLLCGNLKFKINIKSIKKKITYLL